MKNIFLLKLLIASRDFFLKMEIVLTRESKEEK
jgi:hypothetical protein